jgi:hypothetical protein
LQRISETYTDRFLENISCIAEENPVLFERVRHAGGDDRLVEAQDGGLTMRIGTRYLESRFSPERNALRHARRVHSVPARAGTECETYIFLGCGLGYHINELLGGGGTGVLIEKDLDLFRAALYVLDTGILRRLTFWIGLPKEEAIAKIQKLDLAEMKAVPHPVEARISSVYYGAIEDAIHKSRQEQKASDVTVSQSERLWVKNVIKNLCTLGFEGKGRLLGKSCSGKFSGPALLIASGPWLEEIVERIKRYKKKIPVLALLPSLPFLLAHGIEPDLVLSTDAGFWNRYRAVLPEAIRGGCRVPLVTTFSCDPGVTRRWEGSIYLFSHCLDFESLFEFIRSEVISIPMQGTSALVMILLARTMGFDKIFLAGYDFAFKGLLDHHRGAGFDTVHLCGVSRFTTWETETFRRLLNEGYMSAGGQDGERLYTSHKLSLYKNWFEREVVGDDIVRLNNGLRVEGIKTAALETMSSYSADDCVSKIGTLLESCSKRLPAGRVLAELRDARERVFKQKDPKKRCGLVYGKTWKPGRKSPSEDAGFVLQELDRYLKMWEKREEKGRK